MVVTGRNTRWQEMDKSGISLKKLVNHFEAYNRSEGKSPATIYWYSRVLTYFQNYLREKKIPDNLGNLSPFLVRDFILYLQTKGKWGWSNPLLSIGCQ